MAAIICVAVMIVVWIGILVGLHATKGGPYYSFGTREGATGMTTGTYSRTEQTWTATAPRHYQSVHYAPEMPAPLAPPPQGARVAPAQTIAPVWTTTLSADTIEHQLLSALRVRPADAASRMVYSDWLEQRGELVKAGFVRGDELQWPALAQVSTTTDVVWRSITSREHVACVYIKCPKRWDQLDTFGDDERTRRCPACGRTVRYCATTDDARQIRISGDMPVVDLAGQLPPLPLPIDDRFDASAA